jgi:hypothetical protein
MKEPQTASELMMQNQLPKEPLCVLPHKEVQQFLLELVDQSNFPGKLVEFVASVKNVLKNAQIKG